MRDLWRSGTLWMERTAEGTGRAQEVELEVLEALEVLVLSNHAKLEVHIIPGSSNDQTILVY